MPYHADWSQDQYRPVRVEMSTVGALASGAASDTNIVASDQAATVVDGIPPRLLRRVRGQAQPEGNLDGYIRDIFLTMTTSVQPHVIIRYWGNDEFATSTVANRQLLGEEEATDVDFVEDQNGIYIAHLGGLSIEHRDYDDSGEFHVQVDNASASAQGGGMLVEFNFQPRMAG